MGRALRVTIVIDNLALRVVTSLVPVFPRPDLAVNHCFVRVSMMCALSYDDLFVIPRFCDHALLQFSDTVEKQIFGVGPKPCCGLTCFLNAGRLRRKTGYAALPEGPR